ncbi:FCD domain-containing protein [Sphingobium sp.]|uniref:FadR/GntR family transcriptional regulator n=1 Tax=Sphingobium sp. TaxID=1912891 RepID=UPI00262827AC|nr:FCD domain-containing protein [Sphingobium sp.]
MKQLHQEARRESSTVSHTLAGRLQSAILAGDIPVGSSLGSERYLMTKYDCSRASVREALRVLRGQGLIEVKRGRKGGWFISNPSQDPIVQSLDRLIQGEAFRWIDLVNAREAIEAAAAVQAAQFPDEEKLAKLREVNEECERSVHDMEAFVDANLRWHLALAEASGNPLFVAFLTSISKAMHLATELEEFDASVRKAVVGIHWQIYNAIRDGDPAAAQRRTLRHLGAYRVKLETVEALPVPDQADADD